MSLVKFVLDILKVTQVWRLGLNILLKSIPGGYKDKNQFIKSVNSYRHLPLFVFHFRDKEIRCFV